MPKSTITLETQHYQQLCDLIAQQEKVIDIYKEMMKLRDNEIKRLKEIGIEKDALLDKCNIILEEYKKLERILGLDLSNRTNKR